MQFPFCGSTGHQHILHHHGCLPQSANYNPQRGFEACCVLCRNNLGVATFLILDKQTHLSSEMNRAVQVPQGTARLFDLVKCQDKRIRPALYYAFRNTLVADDIDQASKIAYGGDRRWGRVVTLQVQHCCVHTALAQIAASGAVEVACGSLPTHRQVEGSSRCGVYGLRGQSAERMVAPACISVTQ